MTTILKYLVSDNVESYRLFKQMWQIDLEHPTLAMIGCTALPCSLWPVYELQSRWACQVFTGKCQLPPKDEMEKEIVKFGEELQSHWGKYRLTVRIKLYKRNNKKFEKISNQYQYC